MYTSETDAVATWTSQIGSNGGFPPVVFELAKLLGKWTSERNTRRGTLPVGMVSLCAHYPPLFAVINVDIHDQPDCPPRLTKLAANPSTGSAITRNELKYSHIGKQGGACNRLRRNSAVPKRVYRRYASRSGSRDRTSRRKDVEDQEKQLHAPIV